MFHSKSCFICFAVFLSLAFLSCKPVIYHTVVIDPGHGGLEQGQPDDKWDPVQKKFIGSFLPGMRARIDGKTVYEHKEMLKLARRVHEYLSWTQSDEGWQDFLQLLKEFSNQKSFQRICFDAYLSRTDSWDDRFSSPDTPELNAPYRLYDFLDPETKEMRPGRISRMNALRPELIVSLHANPAGHGHAGGMATVLSPSFRTFDLIRRIHLGELPESKFHELPWAETWLVTDPGWSKFEAARADAWVYFHGYRTNRKGSEPDFRKNRGIRYNMITWAYADPSGWEKSYEPNRPGRFSLSYKDFRPEGKFWDRERGKQELWRRADGRKGFGGDNHAASDELLRYAQYGLRLLAPELRKKGKIGPIQPPYTSTYSLPTFSNAIVAYLEIAYLNRKRDYSLITRHREELARSLAVGIYSLFAGLELRPLPQSPYRPDGRPLDFAKYGDYFEDVID